MAFANNPRIVNTGGDDAGEIIHDLLEADSMSFTKGEFVYSNAGAITNVASDGQTILGIALQDATNVTSGNIEVQVEAIKPSYLIKMRITATGTDTYSSSLTVGKAYGLYVASNVCYADADDTSNDAVVYVGPCLDAAGSATYWGLFRVLPAVCQAQTGN